VLLLLEISAAAAGTRMELKNGVKWNMKRLEVRKVAVNLTRTN
jgi:hypothetical protein